MENNVSETIAQLEYENKKLHNELKQTRNHSLTLEENYSQMCAALSQKDCYIKSLKQQILLVSQKLEEKEHMLEALEQANEELSRTNKKLSSDILYYKKELTHVKSENAEIPILKSNEEELKKFIVKAKDENLKLTAELTIKTKEHMMCATTITTLIQKIKEIEDEKLQLIILKDSLLHHMTYEETKMIEDMEKFYTIVPDWEICKTEINVFKNEKYLTKQCQSLNLQEEIHKVEIHEKEVLIRKLENLLHKNKKDKAYICKLIKDLEETLKGTELLTYQGRVNLKIDSLSLKSIHHHLLKIINWSGNQEAECKFFPEITSLSVVANDEIQATQPRQLLVVETTNNATQTDPVENLSYEVLIRTFDTEKKVQYVGVNSVLDARHEVMAVPNMKDAEWLHRPEGFYMPKRVNTNMDTHSASQPCDENLAPTRSEKLKEGRNPQHVCMNFFVCNQNANQSPALNLNLIGLVTYDLSKDIEKVIRNIFCRAKSIGIVSKAEELAFMDYEIKELSTLKLASNEVQKYVQYPAGENGLLVRFVNHRTVVQPRLYLTTKHLLSCMSFKSGDPAFVHRMSKMAVVTKSLHFKKRSSFPTLFHCVDVRYYEKSVLCCIVCKKSNVKTKKKPPCRACFVRFINNYFHKKENFIGTQVCRISPENSIQFEKRRLFLKNVSKFPYHVFNLVIWPNFMGSSSNLSLLDGSIQLKSASLTNCPVKIIYWLRKILKLNNAAVNTVRFRWPDHMLQWFSFLITWYMVLLAVIFVGLLLNGISGCSVLAQALPSPVWFAIIISSFILIRKFYRFLVPFAFAVAFLLFAILLWLTKVILPVLSSEETDKLLRSFGFVVEIRYPNGPPPV